MTIKIGADQESSFMTDRFFGVIDDIAIALADVVLSEGQL